MSSPDGIRTRAATLIERIGPSVQICSVRDAISADMQSGESRSVTSCRPKWMGRRMRKIHFHLLHTRCEEGAGEPGRTVPGSPPRALIVLAPTHPSGSWILQRHTHYLLTTPIEDGANSGSVVGRFG
jgi:hypothetical protein